MTGDRVRGKHKAMAWTDNADRLRISEQYAGRPQDGIVFHVEQRTTMAGRAVMLGRDDVREVRDFLTSVLDAMP
jgi:hypothetical protein